MIKSTSLKNLSKKLSFLLVVKEYLNRNIGNSIYYFFCYGYLYSCLTILINKVNNT